MVSGILRFRILNSHFPSEVNLGRIMVLGSKGMVGSACIRVLEKRSNVSEIIPVCREQVDLTDQAKTLQFIASERPDWVILAAAKVGGIHANNSYPANFIYQNLAIQNNAIEGAFRAGVERLIFLGSSCIYPKHCPQPIKEGYLLTGPLEPTNEPYALAKIAGIKMCESYNRQFGTDYRSLMPANLYGPGDNYHPENSHVIPGLIRRFHRAKINGDLRVQVWGTGKVRREFLFVDDLADAVSYVMGLSNEEILKNTDPMRSHMNVGTGVDLSIGELAAKIAAVVGFDGKVEFNPSMPDGAERKLLDVTLLSSLGWTPRVTLAAGLQSAFASFVDMYR